MGKGKKRSSTSASTPPSNNPPVSNSQIDRPAATPILEKSDKFLVSETKVQSFSGPIPHPYDLEKYNSIVPGLADRIVKMAEQQSAHRMDLEKKVIHSNINKEYLGWLSAAAMGLIVISLGAFLV